LAFASGSANHIVDLETAAAQSRGRYRRNLRFVLSSYSTRIGGTFGINLPW